MVPEHSDRPVRRLVLVAGLATVAFGVALALGWEPGIPGEWVWRGNALPVRLLPALLAGIALVLLSGIACLPPKWDRMRPAARAASLAALVVVVFLLQCAMLNALGAPWVAPGAIIASPPATTYFSVSLDVHRPADWIASYPELMPQLPHHAPTHPPGFVLLFLLVRRLCASLISQPTPGMAAAAEMYADAFGIGLTPSDAAAAMVGALVVALLGALGLVPLYFLARHLSGPRAAICASFMAASMPGLLLLGASPDLIIMALAITALCLGYSAWRSGSLICAFLAGLAVAAGLFFSLAFALVGAWALLWMALGVLGSKDRPAALRRLLGGGVFVLSGFVLFYAALYFIWEYRPIAVVQQAFLAHRDVTTVAFPRTYWKWVLMNPIECALFVGLPVCLAAIWSRAGLSHHPYSGRLKQSLLSWLIILALLDLSGAVRGEVGRIWLFLLWPTAVAGGAWLATRSQRAGVAAILVLLQVAQAILMRGYLTIYSIL